MIDAIHRPLRRLMRNTPPQAPVHSDGEPRSAEAQDDGLARLCESLRPDLLRFAYWLARDRSVAEDVVQEALLRAWRSRDEIRSPAAVCAWLLTIVRREHARLYERKRLELTDLDEVMQREDGGLAVDGKGELFDLRVAITRLPIGYREPLLLQAIGGFTADEIARELRLSIPAVLTRLFRARNKLRAIYGLDPAPEAGNSENPP